MAFVVAGQPTVRGEPGKGALDDPAARVHGEAALLGGLRTISTVVLSVARAQSTNRPAKA